MANGLFVGLITLDCIYRVSHVPSSDEKLVALDSLLVAGGPATNAAIAFAALGNRSTLVGALGQHPLATLIRTELTSYGVEMVDLTPELETPPPLSTILVTAATGDRAVVSRNALGRQADPPEDFALLVNAADVVLIDGHQMAVSWAIATAARQKNRPIVIDAGSWKTGFETVLPLATSVVAAAKFRLSSHDDADATLAALTTLGVAEVAVTHGAGPIQVCDRGHRGTVPVPSMTVIDTLGAGDILHGAFCHYRLSQSFLEALANAAEVATHSCRYFGPRGWIEQRQRCP